LHAEVSALQEFAMENQPVRAGSSSDYDPFTWIVVGGLLILGVLIGVGGLALTSANQHGQTPTGSQSVPSH
jgi:hypothetical protein